MLAHFKKETLLFLANKKVYCRIIWEGKELKIWSVDLMLLVGRPASSTLMSLHPTCTIMHNQLYELEWEWTKLTYVHLDLPLGITILIPMLCISILLIEVLLCTQERCNLFLCATRPLPCVCSTMFRTWVQLGYVYHKNGKYVTKFASGVLVIKYRRKIRQ